MIRFSLVCDKGHTFESWFRDGAAFDSQKEQGHLSCPQCGSGQVGKAIMAPLVARKDRHEPAQAVEAVPAAQPVSLVSPQEQAMRAAIRELHMALTKNSDYVGDSFAAEARRMHDGEAEQRAIHGEAGLDDVKSLIEDGIEVYPLPGLPDDRN